MSNTGPLLSNNDYLSKSELKEFIEEIQKLYDPNVDKDKDVNEKINDYIFNNTDKLLERLENLNEELENDVNGEILQNPGKMLFNRQLINLIDKVKHKKILYENAFNSIEGTFKFTQLLDEHYISKQPERVTYSQSLRNIRNKFRGLTPKMSSITKNH